MSMSAERIQRFRFHVGRDRERPRKQLLARWKVCGACVRNRNWKPCSAWEGNAL
jgi:hypothetical protein